MDIQKFIVQENADVIEVMRQIDTSARGIVFVCRGRQLCAVVTDGDIRRHIMKSGSLTDPIMKIASVPPIFLEQGKENMATAIMERNYITAVPIVNEKQEIVDICFRRIGHPGQKGEKASLRTPLVIMAGGKGTRLKPYTDILPKPLIPIGEKTITEHIIDRFAEYGCQDVMMIVNYKKDFIKAYFKDISTGNEITFIEEEEYLGTGGGLRLLLDHLNTTFFMSNCDIIIDTDYDKMLDYHRMAGNLITMVCAVRRFEIPYGTIQTNAEGYVTELVEKPGFEYKVNTGFYLIEPEFLQKIPEDTYVHITDVIEKCIKGGEKVGTFLIDDENWMDMGQLDELEKMKAKMEVYQ